MDRLLVNRRAREWTASSSCWSSVEEDEPHCMATMWEINEVFIKWERDWLEMRRVWAAELEDGFAMANGANHRWRSEKGFNKLSRDSQWRYKVAGTKCSEEEAGKFCEISSCCRWTITSSTLYNCDCRRSLQLSAVFSCLREMFFACYS